MKNAIIIGGYPPPFGGITVHIQRLFDIISKSYIVEVIDFYGTRETTDSSAIVRCGIKKPLNLIRAAYHIFKIKPDITHFHISAISNFCVAGFPLIWSTQSSTCKVLTIHSGSFSKKINTSNPLKKVAFRYLIKKMDHIIVVNESLKELLCNLDYPVDIISIVPAFLPPVVKKTDIIKNDICKLSKKSDVLILVSGYALRYYGFHTLLEALKKISANNKKISVIFAFYNSYDEQYVKELKANLAHYGPNLIYRDLRPDEFSYLLSLIDIYVRPTDRDGDAVALREAAYFGKQVIASDCVQRPEGTVLFKTMDSDSLSHALDQVIECKSRGRISFDFELNKLRLLDIYSTLLGSK